MGLQSKGSPGLALALIELSRVSRLPLRMSLSSAGFSVLTGTSETLGISLLALKVDFNAVILVASAARLYAGRAAWFVVCDLLTTARRHSSSRSVPLCFKALTRHNA